MMIRGISLAYDPFDADTLELVEREMKTFTQLRNQNFQNQTEADAIRFLCRKVFAFFDAVFGVGTAHQLFQGKHSLTACLEAFEEFVQQKNSKEQEISKRFQKYTQFSQPKQKDLRFPPKNQKRRRS